MTSWPFIPAQSTQEGNLVMASSVWLVYNQTIVAFHYQNLLCMYFFFSKKSQHLHPSWSKFRRLYAAKAGSPLLAFKGGETSWPRHDAHVVIVRICCRHWRLVSARWRVQSSIISWIGSMTLIRESSRLERWSNLTSLPPETDSSWLNRPNNREREAI